MFYQQFQQAKACYTQVKELGDALSLARYFEEVEGSKQVADKVNCMYKKNTPYEVTVSLDKRPTSAEDFYFLAVQPCYMELLDVRDNKYPKNVAEVLQRLKNNLLIDAAMSGHREASRKLVLHKFHCKNNIQIWLPKKLETADEIQMLAVHLKTRGGSGTYYRLVNPDHASRLSYNLLAVAAEMRKKEEMARLEMAYASTRQQARF